MLFHHQYDSSVISALEKPQAILPLVLLLRIVMRTFDLGLVSYMLKIF